MELMKSITSYQNGNTFVSIFEDGTKIREYDGTPVVDHPESIDVKITNYCDMGCVYCHESSTTKGKHGDLNVLLNVLSDLPIGIELAIGGGNPLSHPDLIPFLKNLKDRGFIVNITVNQGHLKVYHDLMWFLIFNNLIHGLGISITSNNLKHIKSLIPYTDNIVYHLIAGVNDISIVNNLMELGKCKILVLGYKQFGFGVDYYSSETEREIQSWRKALPKLIGKCTLSFDNLAIEQLSVRDLFTVEGWDRFYMGDDFVYTMYIDAVNQEFAPTSRSNNRKSFNDTTLLNFFNQGWNTLNAKK